MTTITNNPAESLSDHIRRAESLVTLDSPVQFYFENSLVTVSQEVRDSKIIQRVSIVPRFNAQSFILRARALRNSIRS